MFNFLGSLLSTCSSDLPLLRGMVMNQTSADCFFHLKKNIFLNSYFLRTEGSLRRRKSRPQASLTATHSSTLAEEIVSVLRTLHSLGQWNSMINDYINTLLSSIGDVMAGCQSEAVRIAVLWIQLFCVKMLTHISEASGLIHKISSNKMVIVIVPSFLFSVSWRSISLIRKGLEWVV